MADGDGDADTVPIQSSSERQMASDCNATLNGNSDNSSETQEDIGTSQSMQSIGGKFPPSVVREFEHIYDDDGGGIFIHSSDDEYDDDDDLLDDVVPDVFAPYLPSAESPPATAVNNKKCGYRLSDILDSIDESEEKIPEFDEDVSNGFAQEGNLQQRHTMSPSTHNQAASDVGKRTAEETNIDVKNRGSGRARINKFAFVRPLLTGDIVRTPTNQVRKASDVGKRTDEETNIGVKNRGSGRARIHKFGVVRSLLTGDIVRTPTNQVRKGGVYVASASLAPYLHRLYGSGAPTKQEICDRLFTAPSGFKYGTSYKFKPKADTWAIFWEPQKLMELTTLEISSVICAALNSRRRLHWVIGIGRGLKILGCSVMTQERDTLRQALDYTIRVNISPCLDPNLVHMDFIPVEGQEVDENEMRALITITIDVRVTTFYQLTSGRIFYVSKNELKEIEGGIDEARRMMQLRKSKDHISLVDQDPVYGHFRYTLSKDCHIHPFLLLMTKNVIYFVSGIAAGLIARYALSKVFI